MVSSHLTSDVELIHFFFSIFAQAICLPAAAAAAASPPPGVAEQHLRTRAWKLVFIFENAEAVSTFSIAPAHIVSFQHKHAFRITNVGAFDKENNNVRSLDGQNARKDTAGAHSLATFSDKIFNCFFKWNMTTTYFGWHMLVLTKIQQMCPLNGCREKENCLVDVRGQRSTRAKCNTTAQCTVVIKNSCRYGNNACAQTQTQSTWHRRRIVVQI